ncbi:MAG TPA: hypothetical protein VNZ44_07985, partial [Pyrinomonadaceae bacterium]|nr:hypothetical protein [Pyrinomonadaceae bacterium]
ERHRRIVVDASDTMELALTPAGTPPDVRAVQYLDGDTPIGAPVTAAPWSVRWSPRTPGIHAVLATWQARDGSTGVSDLGLVIARRP